MPSRRKDLEFSKKHDPTTVADMSTTRLVKENCEFNLQIWDSPGDDDALAAMGERNMAADGCMLVYSVLMKRTIKCLEQRLNAYRDACKAAKVKARGG
jgi:GTPase SAR1 family protein